MGGTCSRLVSVKTSKAFKNKVHSSPLPQEEQEKVEGNHTKPTLEDNLEDQNIDTTKEKGEPTAAFQPSDIFSKGDHNEESPKQTDVNTTRVEHYALVHAFARGDYKSEEKQDPNDSYDNVIHVEENNKLQGALPKGDKKQTLASQDDGNTYVDGSQDLNDNSYIRHQIESEIKYNIDVNDLDSSNCDEAEDTVPMTPRGPMESTDKEAEPKQEVSAEVDVIAQDSLFFLPLDNGNQRTTATYRMPERLSRSRKPPLTYSERMLLADCNRFQQLDKKREFAVRRNRSISRLGKLPKIGDSEMEMSENNDNKANNTLNKPDE